MTPKSYKGRRVNYNKEVKVYRNLTRKPGVWYSIVQNGKVVAHSEFVLLFDVKFEVNEAGRQRMLKSGHKNVHAYAVGKPSKQEHFFRAGELIQLTHPARYDQKLGLFTIKYISDFVNSPEYTVIFELPAAAVALLSKDGLSVDEPETGDVTDD